MLRNLVSIGESCVSDAGQLIAWALQDEAVQPLSDDTSEAALLAEQVSLEVLIYFVLCVDTVIANGLKCVVFF